jgi:hypothetical protein
MFKSSTFMLLFGCVAALTLPGSARAEHFDFTPGMGPDILNPDLAYGDGTRYSWYYQGINLDYGGGFVDGREDTTYKDNPNGNIPYLIFDGTDKSTAGHCLQVFFGGPSSDSVNQNAVRNLQISYTDSTGNDQAFLFVDTGTVGTYTTARIWVQNTGSGLYWHTKLADLDGNNGAWNQSATMNVWRLELNQADCTTNAHAANPNLAYATFIGTTGNYTACTQSGCHPGG